MPVEIAKVSVLSPSQTAAGTIGGGQKIVKITVERIGPVGPPGPTGASGLATLVVDEIPGGAIDGANVDFTTALEILGNRLFVYLNGLRLHEGTDYNITSATSFQMIEAPLTGDSLTVDYLRA